ncbi:DNA polymerase III subunit gamma/tau [Candidatus Dependentiae bacterium]|nr:DNA polymerase III subunit gamma/tau [Candidatus Dependentiae bacterium]
MNAPDLSLNLARKWRSANFDQIVGQDLAVRMLKNSLYLQHFFPVYLFAGQRGCGKTTTARVFAAALNCEKLSLFQQKPQEQILPCGDCYSCRCMQQGKHPDFIEMDAASNTGVDHVRNIIDACTLLPVLGNKKIYLIDEAHMLSKAAFNAFLKVMEEPPQSVIFMLATTDEHKIIDTVRSRCFTLTFPAIALPVLTDHLATICAAENIPYEQEALRVIARHVGGSARDALNLVEQVRFAHATITTEAVMSVVGYLSDEQLLQLIKLLCTAPASSMLVAWIAEQNIAQYQPDTVYKRLMQLTHQLVWYLLGDTKALQGQDGALQETIAAVAAPSLTALFGLLVEHEQNLLRTSNRHAYMQMILLMIWQQLQQSAVPSVGRTVQQKQQTAQPVALQEAPAATRPTVVNGGPEAELWQQIMNAVTAAEEPMLYSMVMQARPVSWDAAKGILTIMVPNNLSLFEEMITTAPVLRQALQALHAQATLIVTYDAATSVASTVQRSVVQQQARPMQQKQPSRPATHRTPLRTVDPEQWPITSVLLEELSGTVTEIEEGQ